MHPRRLFFVICITVLLALTSHAIPSAQKPFWRKQPNGVGMTLRLIGDEWFSWDETLDGRPVGKDPVSGYYVYLRPDTNGAAMLTSSRVNIDAPPVGPWRPTGTSAQQKLVSNAQASVTRKSVPSSGTGRVPVLCGAFSDLAPRFTPQAISNMLFTTTAGVRSMSTYYTEVSYGKFTVKSAQGGVRGWYRAPNNRAYYGAQTTNSSGAKINDIRAAQFVSDIVNAAIAAGYDFSGCDQDGDGKVDVVNVVHSGAGQEYSGNSSDDIWSHRFSLSASGLPTITAPNGLIIDDYVIEPELAGPDTSTDIVAPGVFCHEYGHALGLPDLYDPDYTTKGIGMWSGMSYGANNGFTFIGDCPAHFDAWCKAKLGWLTPVNYTLDSTQVSFPNAAQKPFAARLWKDGTASSEYFLVENRYQTNFDSALPTNGLLIWHIDDSKNVGNTGNTWDWCPIAVGGAPATTNSGHKLVMLEQADGLYQFDTTNVAAQNIGDDGDAFPGSSNNRLFSSNTVPNSLAYNVGTKPGFNTYVTVANISDAGPTMTADIYTRSPDSGPDVSWVNIAGVVPPYDGASFAALDAQHPVVVNVLPGPTGVSLSQLQLYLARASDGRWWDWANHVWATNAISNNQNLSGADVNGVTFAYQDNFPSGTDLPSGGYTFILRAINSSAIPTEIQMYMTAVHTPEVHVTLNDNAYVNTLTNFNAVATDNSGTGIQHVDIALFYDGQAYDSGGVSRWYWTGSGWSATEQWLGTDFPTHPTQATLLYPIGPDASALTVDQQYTIAARAYDAAGEAVTNTITVFYDTGTPPTKYWSYSGSGNWFNPANWSPSGIPTASDYVAIDMPGDYTVTINGSAVAASIRFGRNVGLNHHHLWIPQGSSLVLGNNSETNKFFASAIVDQAGDLNVGNYGRFYAGSVLNWTNTSTLFGLVDMNANAQALLSGSGMRQLAGDLINRGEVYWSGNCDIAGSGAARIDNLSYFEVQNDQIFFDNSYYDNQGCTFYNAGVFRKTGGTNVTRFDNGYQGFAFTNNNGFVQIDTGMLQFDSPSYFSDGSYFIGGIVKQAARTMTLSGTNHIDFATTLRVQNATIAGTWLMTGGGTLQTGPAATISGNLTIDSGSTLEFSSDTVSIESSKVVNDGVVNWLSGNIDLSGSVFENDGSFFARAPGGSVVDANYYDNFDGAFVNNGTFTKDTAVTNSFLSDYNSIKFHNAGVLALQAGELDLYGGGSSTNGLFNVAANTLLKFNSVNSSFHGTTHCDVFGAVRVLGATLTSDNSTNTIELGGTFEVAGGTINGTTAFDGPGKTIFSSGTLAGTNVLTSSMNMDITTAAAKGFAAGSLLLNNGTVHWLQGDLGGTGNSSFRNFGLFSAECDYSFYDSDYYDNQGALFENYGTFRKTASTNHTVFRADNQQFVLTNNAIIDLQSGVLEFQSTTLLGHGGVLTGPGTALQSAHNVVISGTNSIATPATRFIVSARMDGNGAFSGAGQLIWTNGAVLNGSWTTQSGVTLNLVPSDQVTFNGGAFLNAFGPVYWLSGNVAISSAIFQNKGSFYARSPQGVFYDYDYYDNSPGFFANYGTFYKDVVATNMFTSDNHGVRFNNWGLLDVQKGVLALNGGGGSTAGRLQNAAGTLVEFNGYDYTMFDNSHVDISGTLQVLNGHVWQSNITDVIEAGGTMELVNGTIGGQGGFSGPGTFIWSGGNFSGTNIVQSGCTMNISGTAGRYLNPTSRLINNGTVLWTGTNDIGATGFAVFENNGLFDVRSDKRFYDSDYYDNQNATFINNGTFRKAASTGVTDFAPDSQGFVYVNNGIIDLQAGTIQFDSSFIPSAGSSMNFTLAGHSAGASFGQIKHSGQMNFGGNINVSYANGFTPSSGDTFPLVVYVTRSGQFGTMNLPTLPSDLNWRADYGLNAFTIATRPMPTCTSAPDGLLAWWSGDGGTNLAGWYSLIATNGATNGLGIDGQAFLLNGVNQYWYAPDTIAFRPTNVTVECWVNFAAVNSLEVIAGKPYGGGNLDSYGIWLENGQLRGGISTTGGFSALASFAWTPPVSSWHHVAYTYDQTAALGTLFLDGAVVATASGSGPIAYDDRPFVVGADIENGNPAYFLNGSIDEVALYNRALGTNEIAAIYAADAAGRCPMPPPNAFITPTISPDKHTFHGQFTGPVGSTGIIEATTNLVNWDPIQTNSPFYGSASIDDPINRTNRFYRMHIIP